MAKSDNPQEVTSVSAPVATMSDLEQFHFMMRERASIVSQERGEEVMARQALAILSAASVEDIERADMGGTIQARDVDGLEVEIRAFEPVISQREDIETREGYYISTESVVLGGDKDMLTRFGLKIGGEIVLQTGASLFILKVAALERAGGLPYRGIVRAIPTQSGNHVVKLFPAPERVR